MTVFALCCLAPNGEKLYLTTDLRRWERLDFLTEPLIAVETMHDAEELQRSGFARHAPHYPVLIDMLDERAVLRRYAMRAQRTVYGWTNDAGQLVQTFSEPSDYSAGAVRCEPDGRFMFWNGTKWEATS